MTDGTLLPSSWRRRDTLPGEVLRVLTRPPGGFVATVATTDADGSPRMATFGVLRAPSPTTLRFGCRPTHTTYANIVRDGRVTVALHAEPDVAVGISGRARIVRDRLDAMPSNAVVEVDVEVVKNDAVQQLPITTGVNYQPTAEMRVQLDAVTAELDAVHVPSDGPADLP